MGNSPSIGVSRAVCPSRTARPFFGDREGGERSRPAAVADLAALASESRSIENVLSDRRLRRSLGQILYEYRIPVQDAEDLIQDVMLGQQVERGLGSRSLAVRHAAEPLHPLLAGTRAARSPL